MTTPDHPTDGVLLAALAVALAPEDTAPADAVEAAIAAFTWRTVDAELLELLYDSSVEPAVAVRAAEPTSRLLTFRSPMLTLEIELTSEVSWVIRGALTPGARYGVELHQGSDVLLDQTNEAGLFELTTTGAQPVRLVIITDPAGGRLMTPWIDLA